MGCAKAPVSSPSSLFKGGSMPKQYLTLARPDSLLRKGLWPTLSGECPAKEPQIRHGFLPPSQAELPSFCYLCFEGRTLQQTSWFSFPRRVVLQSVCICREYVSLNQPGGPHSGAPAIFSGQLSAQEADWLRVSYIPLFRNARSNNFRQKANTHRSTQTHTHTHTHMHWNNLSPRWFWTPAAAVLLGAPLGFLMSVS